MLKDLLPDETEPPQHKTDSTLADKVNALRLQRLEGKTITPISSKNLPYGTPSLAKRVIDRLLQPKPVGNFQNMPEERNEYKPRIGEPTVNINSFMNWVDSLSSYTKKDDTDVK